MRRPFVRFVACLSAAAILAVAQPAPARPVPFSAADQADLDRISAYLNSIRTMKGGFIQIGPDGEIDQGEFSLAKPGRIRFQYQPPTPTLIVSDGTKVAVENTQLKTVDRYRLSETPLNLILADKIDLANDRDIVGIDREQGALVVRARSNSYRTQGNIRLTFSVPDLELRQWTVIDNQGLSTTVALRDQQTGVTLPDSLFVVPGRNPFTGKIVE